MRLTVALVLVALAHGVLAAPQQQSPLTFRSKTELVAVDVQVIDKVGEPIAGLKTKDFEVFINGRPRKVVSADLVTYPIVEARRAALMASVGVVDAAAPVGVVPQLPRDVNGRVVVLAVDEASLTQAAGKRAMKAAKQFVDHLAPEDVVGVYAFPFGPARVDLQHDHAVVAKRLDTVVGRFSKPSSGGMINLTLSEVVDIAGSPAGIANSSGADNALAAVIRRECGVPAPPGCDRLVFMEATTAAAYYETQYQQSLGDFRELLIGLGTVPGRKTVVYISGGMATSDTTGGRPDVSAMLKHAVAVAAASDVSLYIVHIDSSIEEIFSAANKAGTQDEIRASSSVGPPRPGFDPDSNGVRFGNIGREMQIAASGLERLAGDSGGALFRDQTGSGEHAFDRILRETSAYYLLGVESSEADRDGRVHYIRVKANVKNATVRPRTELIIPRK